MKHIHGKSIPSLLAAIAIFFGLTCNAYVVNSVTGNVKISSGGKISTAEKGTKLLKDDRLSVPSGSVIRILDEDTNKEYTSVSTGNMTVGELIEASMKMASDNAGQINSIVNFPSGRGKVAVGSYVHREKGMVTRSLYLFDEEGASIEITPEALARLVSYAVYFGKETANSTLDFISFSDVSPIQDCNTNETGFKLHNPLKTPVYFNVIKLSGIVEREARISPLGQPGGCFVLPAGHSMSRTQPDKVPFGEKHVVVACHYGFDIDSLIEALNLMINDNDKITDFPDDTLPVFIKLIQ